MTDDTDKDAFYDCQQELQRISKHDAAICLSAAANLRIASSWFPHKHIYQLTWYSNEGSTRKIINHILYSG